MTRYISIAHRLTGWNAIKNRAEQIGLALDDAQIKRVTAHIKALADEKQISLDDVDGLLRRWAQANGHGANHPEPGQQVALAPEKASA
jgi:homocitrate synthase